nr:MAG TPA: hypothetical protein [Caudoviricetes sp.]
MPVRIVRVLVWWVRILRLGKEGVYAEEVM